MNTVNSCSFIDQEVFHLFFAFKTDHTKNFLCMTKGNQSNIIHFEISKVVDQKIKTDKPKIKKNTVRAISGISS